MKYPAKFFEDGKYIGVEFPDLPGCFSQGKTLEEAEKNAAHALVNFLDVHKELPKVTALESLKKDSDTIAIRLIETAENGDDTHELMYNETKNCLVTFPKNQEYLGEKLTAKIKTAAGAA